MDLSRTIDDVDSQPILNDIKEELLNINNANPNPYRITRSSKRLLSLIKTNNIKDTNTDIGRATCAG